MVALHAPIATAARAADWLTVGLLGSLQVRLGTDQIALPRGKQRLVLAVLALRGGRPMTVTELIDALWPESPPDTAHQALHVHVAALRHRLNPGRPRGERPSLLRTEPGGYLLDLPEECLDIGRWSRLRRLAGSAAHRDRVAPLEAALALWRGPMLPDLAHAEQIQSDIIRFTRERVDAVADLAGALLDTGRAVDAVPLLHTELREHPDDERLWTRLVRALYLTGGQADALAAFETARRRLARDVGIDPGPELVRIHSAVLHQDPALQPTAAPAAIVPTPVAHPDDIGVVGRDSELAALRALLADRIGAVTVTGVGGVGKTRIARELARSYHDVAWVDLAPVPTAAAVSDAIAAALGVDAEPASRFEATVAELRRRQPLLVLDGLEHLSAATGEIATLVASTATPVLVTSRWALGITSEHVFELRPLAVPPEGPADLREIERSPAVTLFLHRAAAVRPLALTEHTAVPILAVCRLVGGLPLALEIAASRLLLMGVSELAGRLSVSMATLLEGAGNTGHRRTIAVSIDWSRSLLSRDARTLLDRLPVFHGSFDAAAAESVCGTRIAAPLEALAELATAGMLERDCAGDEIRFRVPAMIVEHLRRHHRDLAAQARIVEHARYFVRWATRQGALMLGANPGAAVTTLERDLPNVRAALDWAVEHDAVCAARAPAGHAPVLLAARRCRRTCRTLRESARRPDAAARPTVLDARRAGPILVRDRTLQQRPGAGAPHPRDARGRRVSGGAGRAGHDRCGGVSQHRPAGSRRGHPARHAAARRRPAHPAPAVDVEPAGLACGAVRRPARRRRGLPAGPDRRGGARSAGARSGTTGGPGPRAVSPGAA